MSSALLALALSACLLVALTAGAWLFRRLTDWPMLDRVIASSAPAALAFSVFLERLLDPRLLFWSAALLAPTFSLTHGYTLYYGRTTGPVLATMYGPVFGYGVFVRALSGMPITEEHFRSHFPRSARAVAFRDPRHFGFVKRYVPEFSNPVVLDELPGLTVYARLLAAEGARMA